jgi:hypothetical protein
LRNGPGVADANQSDRLTSGFIDCDERVGSDIGGLDAGGETGARDSERGNVKEVLTAARVGVEAVDPVVAEPRRKVDDVSYRCDGCGEEVLRSAPRVW